MKKIWKLFLAAIIICGTTTVLSSCGGDDDDGGIGGGGGASGGASFKTAKVTYTISVSPALLTDFKVNAYYIEDKNNSALPETLGSGSWNKTVEVDASKMPVTFELYFALTPKNRENGAKATVQGDMEINYTMSVVSLKSDGTTADSNQVQNKFKGTLSSSTVVANFAKDANASKHLSITVNKDGKIK